MDTGCFKFKLNNSSGIVLMLALWTLVILSLLAFGVGHRAGIELRLSRFFVDSLKTSYIAKAGIQTAIAALEKDSPDFDTLYQCGITLNEGQSPEDIFGSIPMGEGNFTVGYNLNESEENAVFVYGMSDEERRININAASNIVLRELLKQVGVDIDAAAIISASIVDWRDNTPEVTDEPNGAEEDFYMALKEPYHCKNAFFDSLEELLLVRGMTQEIFIELKDYVTIYPKSQQQLKINVNTASGVVLFAVALAHIDYVNIVEADAQNLVENILTYRAGSDTIEATEDDNLIDFGNFDLFFDMGLTTNGGQLFNSLKNNFIFMKSDYFRVKSQGISSDGKIRTNINAVIERSGLAIVYWHEG